MVLWESIKQLLPSAMSYDHSWREVGATGQPAFQNSWVNFGTPYETAAFYKDSNGIVHLKGLIKSGTVNTIAFTLPVGYRPLKALLFPNGSNGSIGISVIDSTGGVNPAIGSNVYFGLDGITFKAGQ